MDINRQNRFWSTFLLTGSLGECWVAAAQPAQYVGPMLNQCWSNVYDVGPTLDQHRANVLWLLGGSAE